ncbi:MAG: hypothetical protein ACLGHN_08300 [Bacteriovoracia bacterium]
MKLLFLISILAIFSSCANQKAIKKDHLVGGHCEGRFQETKLGGGEIIWQKISEGTGTSMSYLATGLAYSTDIAISFTGGVVAAVTVCSPLIALESAARSNGTISGECVGKVSGKAISILNPNLGTKAYEGTSSWRCPDLDAIALGLVAVSDCYKEQDDIRRARDQLHQIIDSRVFQECLTSKTMRKIKKKLKST